MGVQLAKSYFMMTAIAKGMHAKRVANGEVIKLQRMATDVDKRGPEKHSSHMSSEQRTTRHKVITECHISTEAADITRDMCAEPPPPLG